VGRNRRAGAPRGVTSSETSSSAIDQPLGDMPLARSVGLEEKRSLGQRVLDGMVPGVRRGRAQAASKRGRTQAASNTASFENDIWLSTAMIP
jgi:hypothetical protein